MRTYEKIALALTVTIVLAIICSIVLNVRHINTPTEPTTYIQQKTPTIYNVDYLQTEVTLNLKCFYLRVEYTNHNPNEHITLLNAIVNDKNVSIITYTQEYCDLLYNWNPLPIKSLNITLTFNNGIANFTK